MTRQVSAAGARDQRAMGGTAPPPGKMPPHGYPRPAAPEDRSQRGPARDQWVRNQSQSRPGFPPDARPAEQRQDAPAGPAQRRNGEMTRQVSAAGARDQRAMGGTAPPPGKMPPHGYPRPAAPAQDRSQRDQPGGEERREDPAGTRRPPAALSSDVPTGTPGLGFIAGGGPPAPQANGRRRPDPHGRDGTLIFKRRLAACSRRLSSMGGDVGSPCAPGHEQPSDQARGEG